ncbi:MAG TPA: peptide chain release factor N(5)-glutamine methyltransferase [Candidatus Wujingus californicus]|uniref:peptide chain release factor N(5)-glutamine methyltransferase n=2 Tax=Candidatus Wujingus californicus TaxID=3367618 RepID=UPI001D327AD8|nr:peptide chain release factor N(5)-glutamine methyltransferase [Planctomycetota bacterium]MDO8131283.1 peptide chain release factor N(5)-glutamine methyltransferase [Candidatus Brocadiales bacterium]
MNEQPKRMPPESNKVNTHKRSYNLNKNLYNDIRTNQINPIVNLEETLPDKPTIFNLTNWANKLLLDSGIESPRLDTEIILAHSAGLNRVYLHTHPDESLEDTIVKRFVNNVKRRLRRVPLQYITNHSEFMSLDFYVDERVLIPRPETEFLIDTVTKIALSSYKENEVFIVDIGVGSGNIAITLAKKIKNARIFAIDISPNAIEVAKFNAQRHDVMEKITFLCGDTFKPLNGLGLESKINFIVSNPPYISSDEFHFLQEEVKCFEPYTALVSGKDGLEAFKSIISDANTWLKRNGLIVFEVAEGQAQKVVKLIKDKRCFKNIDSIKDYQKIDRIVFAQMEDIRGQNCN